MKTSRRISIIRGRSNMTPDSPIVAAKVPIVKLSTLKKDELLKMAESFGIDTADMTKAELIKALQEVEN